jgi:alpha-glucosidase
MMQFSWAPWRLLSKETLSFVKEMADLHCKMSDYILSLVKNALSSGEPIVRFMEYNYPHKGYHGITDQFMLGDDVLVAPVITKGTRTRNVVFPEGTWRDAEGNLYVGDREVSVAAPLGKLLYYTRENCK